MRGELRPGLDYRRMRLFVAIPLGAAVVDELSAIRTRLQSREDGLRWAAAESWHVTLQFLGKTNEEQYECVVARLREVRSAPTPIALEGLGFFERAGVFFAGVHCDRSCTGSRALRGLWRKSFCCLRAFRVAKAPVRDSRAVCTEGRLDSSGATVSERQQARTVTRMA